jgi:hypothetical protein
VSPFKISIFPAVYDIEGGLMLDVSAAGSSLINNARRVQRYATLDGGAFLDDQGYSDGDKTLSFVVSAPPQSIIDRLVYFQKTYDELTLTTIEGSFVGAIERVALSQSGLSVDFLAERSA